MSERFIWETDEITKFSIIGKLVTFKIASLEGPMKVTGIVKRVLPNNKVEIKTQLHGCHIINGNELRIPVMDARIRRILDRHDRP